MPRAATRMPQTKPGSMNHEIATHVVRTVDALGTPCAMAVHREAFRTHHGVLPPAYAARFYGMVRDGVLVAVDGRTSHTRYAHRDQVDALARHRPSDDSVRDMAATITTLAVDDGALVLAALRTACAEHGRAVTTREVAAVARTQGHVIGGGDPNAVRQRLMILSASRTRGRAEWHAPSVQRDTIIDRLGRSSSRWRLVESDVGVEPSVPASASEALRTVVAQVTAIFQRPVALKELRLFLRVSPTTPAARVLQGLAISDLLPAVVHFDRTQRARTVEGAMANGTAGARLVVYAADRAVAGLAPHRVALESAGARDSDALLRCRLLDAITALACADELREIVVLERRAARLASPSLATLAHVRRDALWAALRAVVTNTAAEALALRASERDETSTPSLDATVLAATSVLTVGLTTMLRWIERAQHKARGTTTLIALRARLTAQRAHLEAVHGALRASQRDGVVLLDAATADPAVVCVSAKTAVPLEALQPYLAAAADEWQRERTTKTYHALLTTVRHGADDARALHRAPRGTRTGARLLVDRAEALATLYRALPVARAGVLITGAMELLGRVVRDVPLLTAIRDASRPVTATAARPSPDDHPSTWRSAVVALGLLGVVPTAADVAAAGALLGHDRTAVLLGAVLADVQAATGLLDALERHAGGASAGLAVAKRRLALGRLMTVVA